MTGVTISTYSQVPRQADDDAQLVALWLHGKARTTQAAYRFEIQRFLETVEKPLRAVTLGDLHAHADSLAHLSDVARARAVNAVKSLLTFAHRLGYLPFNVGGPLQAPKVKNRLVERILAEADVLRLIAAANTPRNRPLLALLYVGGLRVSELCGLKWRDLTPRQNGQGQVTVFGKGGKTRFVLLPAKLFADILALRGDMDPDDPVFRSRKGGGHLDRSQVLRIVQAAAKRAGIAGNVSPHWLRHAHASHALDRGAPIHLVQTTLGHAGVSTTSRYLHSRPGDSSCRYLTS